MDFYGRPSFLQDVQAGFHDFGADAIPVSDCDGNLFHIGAKLRILGEGQAYQLFGGGIRM